MSKTKAFLIVVTALFLNNSFNNICFAAESTESTEAKSRYPNYANEFAGQDKCECFNRKMFIFNSNLNKFVIRPVNTVWASIMPKYGMDRVQNFYTNIEFPKRAVCCLLQKDFKGSGKETVRFLTNSTLGLGGLYDPAKSWFKIEARQEDAEQVLAHYKVKKGPYLVLPIIPPSNVRGIAGRLLDCPLDPSLYIIGPVTMIAKAGSYVNKTTSFQPLIKTINSTYADPYEVTKILFGVEDYIKNSNLDRKDVLAELAGAQTTDKINNEAAAPKVKSDIELTGYSPQGPLIDSMRTALFDVPNIDESKWSEMSIWNRSFSKQIKTSFVNVTPSRQNYKFRYVLQKNKNAPLAIIYPSLGEGVMSHHPSVLAKIFYDEGYSVVIQGSTFQWEFVKSMPESYRPGMPSQDADCARMVTSKIINSLETTKACKFSKKILVGTSFGAITTLFIASKEETNNTLGISNYISINPPVEILFALKQLDKNTQEWSENPADIKMRAAITAGKIMQVAQEMSTAKDGEKKVESLPFTDDEAKLILGFIMKQKLSDLVFTIENCSKCKCNSKIYESINKMSFYDYAQKYLLAKENKTYDQTNYETSLYSLASFLQTNEKYKIYHSLDDYFVSNEQLAWLKKQCNNKAVFFSNGSHLGFLYRKEFIDEFKKDIALQAVPPKVGASQTKQDTLLSEIK